MFVQDELCGVGPLKGSDSQRNHVHYFSAKVNSLRLWDVECTPDDPISSAEVLAMRYHSFVFCTCLFVGA